MIPKADFDFLKEATRRSWLSLCRILRVRERTTLFDSTDGRPFGPIDDDGTMGTKSNGNLDFLTIDDGPSALPMPNILGKRSNTPLLTLNVR